MVIVMCPLLLPSYMLTDILTWTVAGSLTGDWQADCERSCQVFQHVCQEGLSVTQFLMDREVKSFVTVDYSTPLSHGLPKERCQLTRDAVARTRPPNGRDHTVWSTVSATAVVSVGVCDCVCVSREST